jgi:hypothetical protein
MDRRRLRIAGRYDICVVEIDLGSLERRFALRGPARAGV